MGGSPSQGFNELGARPRLSVAVGRAVQFYSQGHRFYCGVDLHTRTLSVCVLDQAGGVALEATLPPESDRFLEAVATDWWWPTRRNRFGPAAGIGQRPLT